MLSLGIRVSNNNNDSNSNHNKNNSNKRKFLHGWNRGPMPARKLTQDSGGAETKAREAFGECTYCDPNFMAIPGIEEALRGYDVPMGNPNPGYVFKARTYLLVIWGLEQ